MEDVLFAESLFNIDKESLSVKGFKIFKRFTRNDGKANRMNIVVATKAKKAAEAIRARGVDGAKQSVNNLLNEAFEYCKDMIDSTVFGIWSDGGVASDHKVTAAIVTMCYLLVVIIFLTYVTVFLFGNGLVYTILSAVVFAPLFEEAAKQVSIRGGFAREFFTVFNMFEFSEYVMIYFPAFGVSIIPVRLAAIGLHLTSTIVQWTVGHNKELFNDPTIREEDRVAKARNLGYIIGVLIHFLWNGSALLSEILR